MFRSSAGRRLRSAPLLAIPKRVRLPAAGPQSQLFSRPRNRNPSCERLSRCYLWLRRARALSAYHSQRTHSKEAASYRAQASKLRKEAAILETELIKERKALEALRELENPKPAETTTPPQPVLVAKAGAVEVRWALDDAGALKAKVAAGGATLDLEGSWRASDRTVLLAASGVLGVRVACEAPMMAAEGVRAARERRRTCERALARAEQAAPEVVKALYALDGVDAPAGRLRWVRRRLAAARRRRRARRVARSPRGRSPTRAPTRALGRRRPALRRPGDHRDARRRRSGRRRVGRHRVRRTESGGLRAQARPPAALRALLAEPRRAAAPRRGALGAQRRARFPRRWRLQAQGRGSQKNGGQHSPRP